MLHSNYDNKTGTRTPQKNRHTQNSPRKSKKTGNTPKSVIFAPEKNSFLWVGHDSNRKNQTYTTLTSQIYTWRTLVQTIRSIFCWCSNHTVLAWNMESCWSLSLSRPFKYIRLCLALHRTGHTDAFQKLREPIYRWRCRRSGWVRINSKNMRKIELRKIFLFLSSFFCTISQY